jgi:hypothetical protein
MGFGSHPAEPVTDERLGTTVDELFTPTGHGGKHRERLVVEKPARLGHPVAPEIEVEIEQQAASSGCRAIRRRRQIRHGNLGTRRQNG